jgi:hypothetical protein
MFTLRNVLIEKDGMYSLNKSEQPLLDYYANSIKHLVVRISRESDQAIDVSS